MKLMRELRYIFPRKQRLLFLCLFFLQLVQTAMDFFSVSLILPFVNLLVTPERLDANGRCRACSYSSGSSARTSAPRSC